MSGSANIVKLAFEMTGLSIESADLWNQEMVGVCVVGHGAVLLFPSLVLCSAGRC